MSDHKSGPPRLAVWLLRMMRPSDDEVLVGDLVESFREGKSRGWFWRQVLIAIAVSIGIAMRRGWPQICYAIAATVMPIVSWIAFRNVTFGLRWWELPWPWSQILMVLKDPGTLSALPVLGVGLWIQGTFRWTSLVRAQLLSLTSLVLHTFLVSLFPWLQIHVTARSWTDVYVPRILQLAMLFSLFLFSAWVGCVLPRKNKKSLA